MAQLAAWSFSRIKSFEDCPKAFWHISVNKDVPFQETQATREGKQTHETIADYMRGNIKQMPLHLRHHEKFLAQIKAAPGEKVIEQQIALDAQYQMTDWFAKNAYLRVISDLTILNGNSAVVFDWKTGKRSDDFTQLKLTAATTFLLAPEIESIRVAFYWMKDKAAPSDVITREQAPDVWNEILPRVQRYQEAHDANSFPARPGRNCKWCPVKTCPYSEKK
jgi:hypothetical protein